jgi:hypothetical protein
MRHPALLRLMGDYDGSSAFELLNALKNFD